MARLSTRIAPWILLGGAAPALASCDSSGGYVREAKRSNVVLIVIDTLRGDLLLKGGMVRTPNLDALAADGAVFQRAIAQAPITLPSHASLFSARTPDETGVLNNGQRIDPELPLFASSLQQAGYRTEAVVSLATLKFGAGESGLERGFDAYDVRFWSMADADDVQARLAEHLPGLVDRQPFFLFVHFCEPHEPYDVHGGVSKTAEVRLDGTPAAVLTTSRSSIWETEVELAPGRHEVEVTSEDEFYLRRIQASVNGVDLPITWEEGAQLVAAHKVRLALDMPEGDLRLCRMRLWVNDVVQARGQVFQRYLGEVERVDRAVGQVIQDLKDLGLYEGAIVVLTADHGEELGEHDTYGHVDSVYDPAIHVPLVIKLPQGHPALEVLRERGKRVARLIDVVPTILELLGEPGLSGQSGVSLLRPTLEAASSQTHRPESRTDAIALCDDQYKLIYFPLEDRFEMYDLTVDAQERRDVFATHSARRPDWPARLRAVAERAARVESSMPLDPELEDRLRALGYADR
jgi:membrane-anchored protein YejM (alkaline phosphatase superfamily)